MQKAVSIGLSPAQPSGKVATKVLFNGQCGPITQSTAAVKALLTWKGMACDPLPEFVEMGKEDSRLVLVLSNKKDAYYTTTAWGCSCPGHAFARGNPCEHQRKYFPDPAMDSIRSEAMPMEA